MFGNLQAEFDEQDEIDGYQELCDAIQGIVSNYHI
jgi:hypothetical protein